MPGKLANRTALVTGANRGIGLAIAKEFATEGANVLLAGRNKAALEKLRGEIAAKGGTAEVWVVDFEKEDSIRAMAKAIVAKHPALDILIGNAASLGARVPLTRLVCRRQSRLRNSVSVLADNQPIKGQLRTSALETKAIGRAALSA